MNDWKQVLKLSFKKLDELSTFLNLDEKNKALLFSHRTFPLLVPRRLAEKMKKNDLTCPIFRQFVPTVEENFHSDQFSCDPVEDHLFKKTDHLLHKYAHRMLVITTQACAMHCRYCFRQNYAYEVSTNYEKELLIIQNDPSIQEVILSGGDPLSLSDEKLFALLSQLESIPHVKIIRFHTRFLIGIPERISSLFLEKLKEIKKQIIIVIHSNHPVELDEDVLHSIKQLQSLKIPILCQTVLLKGVNDDIETLKTLCWKLIENGIIPYYLHQLDQVQGAMHFEVLQQKGLSLIEELRAYLPGYAMYQYVKEIPHKKHKTPLPIHL